MNRFVVSEDLADFSHEHPEPAGRGVFRLTHRFPRPGRYRLFADVAPKDAGSQVLSTVIPVGPPAAGSSVSPSPAPSPVQRTKVALTLPGGGLFAGRTVVVTARLTDQKGRPIN